MFGKIEPLIFWPSFCIERSDIAISQTMLTPWQYHGGFCICTLFLVPVLAVPYIDEMNMNTGCVLQVFF